MTPDTPESGLRVTGLQISGLKMSGLDGGSARKPPSYGASRPEFQKTIEIHDRQRPPTSGAPFSIRRMTKDGGAYKVTLYPGYVRDLLTKAAVNAVVFTMVEYDGTPLDADEPPEITMNAGDFLYVNYATEDDGTIKSDPKPNIVSDAGEKETIHYQPADGEGSAGTEGDYYIKIGQLVVSGDKLRWTQFQNSDIEHVHELWTGTNEGGGSAVYKERSGEDDDYKFRTIKGLYGLTDEETDAQVNLNFEAENVVDEGETAEGQVYVDTNGAGDDVAAQFRTIRGLRSTDPNYDGQQIQVSTTGSTVLVRGNTINGSMQFVCDGSLVGELSWVDGLITTEGSEIQVDLCCNCDETDAPPPP